MISDRVLLSWSGGKDSALALDELRRRGVEVAALVTTVTAGTDRVSMHGVRRELLAEQADSAGLPLCEVMIPNAATNVEYEAALGRAFARYRAEGISTVAFGDLFLEDVRVYRERMLPTLGMRPSFPIWGVDTKTLAERFVARGFGAVVVAVDVRALDRSFAGRLLDGSFFADLPTTVDPCGENGEFHTFVFDGPIFRAPICFSVGECTERGDFAFCDLLPASTR